MSGGSLRFPGQPSETSFKLLELPPEVLKLIEDGADLSIKGRSNDDAVLCTPTTTYAIRSISISNTSVLCTSTTGEETTPSYGGSTDNVFLVRDQLHEVLELVPVVPRLERLETLLEGSEMSLSEQSGMEIKETEGRAAKRQRITYNQAKRVIQASEEELETGMKNSRILSMDGELRPLSLESLTQFLLQSLNLIASNSYSLSAVPIDPLGDALYQEYDVSTEVTRQVVQWFGQVEKGKWNIDLNKIVTQVGLGLLSEHKEPVSEDEFCSKWAAAVGDTFEENISLSLLQGYHISSSTDPSPRAPYTIRYFPRTSLSTTPALRFGDLFATRSKWRSDTLLPFLEDIAVGSKERDRLLLKFCRSMTDADGVVWYTARIKY